MSQLPLTRDVTARGLRTRVLEAGSGPALVLLHGFLTSHHSFADMIEQLCPHFHVVAVDLPGFGESEKPPPARYPYTLEAYAEVIIDVIAALHLGRCHLLGHALGGAVALTLAAEHAEFVDHLALVAPYIYPSPQPLATRLLQLPLLSPVLVKQVLNRAMFRSYFNNYLYAPDYCVPAERLDRYFASFNIPAGRESAYAVLKSLRETRPSVARLTRVRAPTLVLWGRADALLSPHYAPRIVRQLPCAQLEMLDTGHSPHEEQPAQLVAMLERFLSDQRQ